MVIWWLSFLSNFYTEQKKKKKHGTINYNKAKEQTNKFSWLYIKIIHFKINLADPFSKDKGWAVQRKKYLNVKNCAQITDCVYCRKNIIKNIFLKAKKSSYDT